MLVPLTSLDPQGELWEMRTWGDANASSLMTMVPSEIVKLIFKKDEVMRVDVLLLQGHSSEGCPVHIEAVVSSAWETLWTKATGAALHQRPHRQATSRIPADAQEQSVDEMMLQGFQSLSGPRPPRAERQPRARDPTIGPRHDAPRQARRHRHHDVLVLADPEDSDDDDSDDDVLLVLEPLGAQEAGVQDSRSLTLS